MHPTESDDVWLLQVKCCLLGRSWHYYQFAVAVNFEDLAYSEPQA